MIPRSEKFKRIELMLGTDACDRLMNSHVLVVGLGAVGGYAVEGLVRAGIGRLTMVDCDKICPSNINRQLLALESTIGRNKCEVARERILDINPECKVDSICGFIDAESIVKYLDEKPDLVIDAIDSLNPKTDLLAAARERGMPVISCLGAALRFDPTLVRTGTLEDVRHCPLGKSIRKRLRKREVPTDIKCVYSDELLPRPLPIEPPSEDPAELPPFWRGRSRNTLGSLPTVTGIFGLTAANLAIRMLIGKD